MNKKASYGGMAVIEGVMMRGPEDTALAVRKPDGSIEVEKEPNSNLRTRYPFLKWPLIRGSYVLIESMVVGVQMLNKSANMSLEEEEEELSTKEIFITGLVAFGMAILLFVALPTAIVHYTKQFIGGVLGQNIVEGMIRIIFFLAYVYAISKMKDIERVFMYHGAEHKSINAHEAGVELTVANARKYSTMHPRCGTSFLLIVMVISILVFALLGEGTLFYRIWSRIAVFPVVAGLGYEFIRFSGKCYQRTWAKFLIAPGLWLQKLTTREPDDDQLEVALAALREVLVDEAGAALA
jgi:Predicted metal-dependent enzyme